MSTLQERSYIANDSHMAVPNNAPAQVESSDSSRFSKLRNVIGGQKEHTVIANEPIVETAPRYSKGLVLDVIPPKHAERMVIAKHFPNASRRMMEFSSTPKPAKPKSNVLGNIKDSLFGAKEGAVIKGVRDEDGKQLRITPEDELMWRRLHLKSRDKERQMAGSLRGSQAIKARRESMHAENKLWKQKVDRMRSKKDLDLKERRAHFKELSDNASARHQAFIDERVRKLAFKDRLRTMKVKKIEAGRKIEHKFLKKNIKNIPHME
eukprot:GILI01000415.1.p1 GENE.GILI01000415.1~~GILI01000415.1.p1  ORF type:complete len:290 (+),score=88.68 GILI01000415.1:76-870(+)